MIAATVLGCSAGTTPAPASRAWTTTGAMSVIRAGHVATLLPNGKVLVAAGVGGTNDAAVPIASAELYDYAKGTWTTEANMIEPAFWPTATLLPNGRVLVVGGTGTDGSYLPSAQVYNPETGGWSLAEGMTQGRAGHTATLLADGRVLVTGGLEAQSTFAQYAEVFDPRTGSWTSAGQMTLPRVDHTATLLSDGRVLVVGGRTWFGATGDTELYYPVDWQSIVKAGTWIDIASIGVPGANGVTPVEAHEHHTATLLRDGRVLIVGGRDDSGKLLASAWLYDPAGVGWAPTAHMAAARYDHTATLLKDGRVLVAGGIGSGQKALSSAEIYDPVTGTWTSAGEMLERRGLFAATSLLDGRVLVSGGQQGGPDDPLPLLSSADLFDPTVH
jgi:N-acetylneuraminic acid mutarotase